MLDQTDYMIVITPRGIMRRRKKGSERRRAVLAEIERTLFIIRSELRGRAFDKTLGLSYLALEPIIQATLYYMLTQVLFGARLTTLSFASIYLTVVFWRWFAKTVDGSPNLFVSSSTILRQSNFSVNSVLFSYIGIEIANLMISLIVLAVFFVWLGVTPKLA